MQVIGAHGAPAAHCTHQDLRVVNTSSNAAPHPFALALERLEGDTVLFQTIGEMFIHSHAEMLLRIRDHLLLDQREAAEHAAHALKGAVANFGIESVIQAVREVELLCHQGQLEAARQKLAGLQSAVVSLVADLQHYCKNQ